MGIHNVNIVNEIGNIENAYLIYFRHEKVHKGFVEEGQAFGHGVGIGEEVSDNIYA